MIDEKFMKIAIKEATKGTKTDEVPVGAVIVHEGKVIAKAHNEKEKRKCANYHAEMVAINKACKKIGDWRLLDCDLYVTMEPCPMCTGALINARIDNIYFGAYDQKAGCCGSKYQLANEGGFNHSINVVGGILENECATILSNYFKGKRGKK